MPKLITLMIVAALSLVLAPVAVGATEGKDTVSSEEPVFGWSDEAPSETEDSGDDETALPRRRLGRSYAR